MFVIIDQGKDDFVIADNAQAIGTSELWARSSEYRECVVEASFGDNYIRLGKYKDKKRAQEVAMGVVMAIKAWTLRLEGAEPVFEMPEE